MDYREHHEALPKVASQLGTALPRQDHVEDFWPLLERMRQEGAVVLLKLDGERSGPGARPYTTVVSGGALGAEHVRTDARTVGDALTFAVVSYFGKADR